LLPPVASGPIPGPQSGAEELLLLVGIQTQMKEISMQAGFSNLLETQSQATINSMNIAQAIASAFATQMENATAQSTMATDNAIYNTMMTEISDLNNKNSNIIQTTGTIVTNLTQVQSQSLQLCQVTVDFMNAMGQLITVWAG